MTPVVQEIMVYVLFAAAIGYFAVRFYLKNIKRKNKNEWGHGCQSTGCGCAK